ncbi:hypothetical protein BH23ACT9_BH23ACT9_23500 [soil metagenome]
MNLGAPELFIILLVLGLAVIPAKIAKTKGYPFALWYVAGLFFLLPALLIVLFLPGKGTDGPAHRNGRVLHHRATRCPSCEGLPRHLTYQQAGTAFGTSRSRMPGVRSQAVSHDRRS